MGTTEMSEQELNKAMVIGQVLEKRITQKDAASRLNLSTRHIRRLMHKLKVYGPSSLAHKSRGKTKPAKFNQSLQDKIIKLLQTKYSDFGPTLAAEKLEEIEHIQVSAEWLRRLMISRGMWRAKSKRTLVYSPRARRPKYGELIQVDGSHHHWFEDRGAKCVALVFVDDATSRLQTVHFCNTENLRGYLQATKKYLESYGCPQELYSDKHSVFTINHCRGGENTGQTHYAKVLSEFNIQLHLASSPQAKGRVERMNRVLQDRLVKEFRLNNISTIEQANNFMPSFIEGYNQKFHREPKVQGDAHLKLTQQQFLDMDNILAIKEKRTVSKALTVQYKSRIYIINQVRAVRTLRKRGVTVVERLNGDIKMFSGDNELAIEFFEYADNYIEAISRKELDIKLDSFKCDGSINKIHPAVIDHNNRTFLNSGKPDIFK